MTAHRRTIVITGAGRGLGLGLARHFAPTDRVIGTARRPDAAPDLAAVAEQTLALDVASDDSIAALAAGAEQIGPIDILINNAGINALAVRSQTGNGSGGGRGRGVLDTDRADFLGQVDVNAAGPLLVTQALLPQLEAGGGALVVNISSQLGSMEVGAQMGQDLGYNASKAALNMVTVRAAAELGGRGVAVVAIHPGWVKTDMGGSAAALSVEESAAAVGATIESLSMADTGRFLRWDGTPHPW